MRIVPPKREVVFNVVVKSHVVLGGIYIILVAILIHIHSATECIGSLWCVKPNYTLISQESVGPSDRP